MALAGYDTLTTVINDTSTTTSYSGTLNGVTTGDLVVVLISADGNANTQDPSAWTVTIGSDTLTHRASGTTTLTEAFCAVFSGVATATGNQTLAVTTVNATRALAANAALVTGYDTTTPHPNSGSAQPGSNATSLTSPSAVTTAADGNVILGCVGVHGGDVTALAVSGADGSVTGQTGTNAFNDVEWGAAYKLTATAAAVSFAWTWTTSDRPGAAWVEIAVASGGGTTVSFDALSYSLTLPALTANVNTPVSFDALSYTETVPTLSVSVDTPVSLDALAYTETLNDISIATTVDTPVALDTLAYTLTLPDLSVSVDTPVALDTLAYTETLNDIGVAVDTPVSLDTLAYTETIHDLTVGTNVSVTLDTLDYTLTLNDLTASQRRTARGDDAGRSGERERFWKAKAEEWLEDYIERLPKVAKKPTAARKRAAKRLVKQAEAATVEWPELAPRIDYIAALSRQLTETAPDMTAIATALAAQLGQIEAERLARRRKRDLVAVLLLAA